MNCKILLKKLRLPALALAVLALAAAPSFAQTTYDLCATTGTATMPDTTVVPIWGYVDITGGGDCTTAVAALPGPVLRPTPGDTTLTVTLTNNLGEPVSLFVPGLRANSTTGVPGRFTAEAAASGGTASYTFTLRPGTFPYHSATDRIRTQVPMGLYGALVVDPAAGMAYPGVPYYEDEVLVFSEIDPALNADPAGFGGARVINWNPQYFLINGESNQSIAISTNQDVLLRFVNAGLHTYAPTLGGGLYMSLKAEDGNRYPHPIEQYGLELQAGKTIDAIVNAASDGNYALYDRALHLSNGGMVAQLLASAVGGAPVAVDDPATAGDYTIVEDAVGGLVVVAPGVLANDTGAAVAAVLVSGPSNGTLPGGLAADGSFSYTPNANFNGEDTFTYVANDGAGGPNSNVATATITVTPVNDAPVAAADGYDAVEGAPLDVASPGVLGNDTDVDGDALNAALVSGPIVAVDADTSATSAGALLLNVDGSFSHDQTGTGLNAGDQVTFDYEACDPSLECSTATVTITVVAAPPPPDNIAPIANDDTTSTPRNTPLVNYDIVANDEDPDGTIDPMSVVITTGSTTQAGGTVVNNLDGTITYTPKSAGYRGTDTFQYTVNDNDGATSNVATVRINVTR